MRRTEKLAFNTVLFAISNFGSKALSFFLVPFYTAVLTTEQYGTVDLVLTSNSLLMPLVTLSMADAVLRFSMDKNCKKNDVFTTGILVVIGGALISILLMPLLSGSLQLSEHWIYATLILFFNSVYNIMSQFCRGISKVLQFSIGGLIQTAVLVVSNVVLLLVFSWGIKGYLLSLIISYSSASLFLFISAKLYLFLDGRIHKQLFKSMLKYALPLIPNTILWWVMNASDKFFIVKLLGKANNGIYAVANKFPSIINMISIVFFQAWQLSAIEEVDSKDRSEYYSSAFCNLSSVIVLSVSGILVILKPAFSIWTSESYYIAWKYSPLLLFATMFMCFSSFWGSNLVAMKKTGGILKSAEIGGLANILLNTVLIPSLGLYGAAFATVVGFFLTWFVRYIDGRKYLTIEINYKKFLLNLLILLLQTVVLYFEFYLVLEFALFAISAIVNRSLICDLANFIKLIFRKCMKKKV